MDSKPKDSISTWHMLQQKIRCIAVIRGCSWICLLVGYSKTRVDALLSTFCHALTPSRSPILSLSLYLFCCVFSSLFWNVNCMVDDWWVTMWEDRSAQLCKAARISLSILFLSSSPCRHRCCLPCVHTCTPPPIACWDLEACILYRLFSTLLPTSISFAFSLTHNYTKLYTQYMFGMGSQKRCTQMQHRAYEAAGGITEEIWLLLDWGMTHSLHKLPMLRTSRVQISYLNGRKQEGRKEGSLEGKK